MKELGHKNRSWTATSITVRQSKAGMFFADCPSEGKVQVHRGETLYDLARNVQLSHGQDIEWATDETG